jgi:hypothetical protein
MSKHPLNYKVLYSPEENFEKLRQLYNEEQEKNYVLTVAYSDMGAFLTPLSTMAIQNNAKNYRKNLFDILFGEYNIREGFKTSDIKHININLKTFVDFNNTDLEIVMK